MTYEEIIKIVGQNGTLSQEYILLDNTHVLIYKWNIGKWKYIEIHFGNNKVYQKYQYGL